MKFSDKIYDIFSESPIDPVRNKLDPDLFNDDNELKDEVLDFLKGIIQEIDNEIVPVVGKSLIKGSILSYQWLPHTDVDLLIEIEEDVNDHQWDVIGDQIENRYDGLMIPGTKHPLQIFAHRGEYNFENADGIYDLYKGWVKGPYTHEMNINQYLDQFKEVVQDIDLMTGELRRDLIDHDILDELDEDEIKGLKAKLSEIVDEIELDVEDILNKRQKIKDARRFAFDREMTPEEIKKFGSKNLLPANVIQKMLEKYHYMKMMSKIKNLMKDDRLSDDDIEELKDIFNIEGVG